MDTASSLPGRKIWLDSFVIQKDPVTIGEFLESPPDPVQVRAHATRYSWDETVAMLSARFQELVP